MPNLYFLNYAVRWGGLTGFTCTLALSAAGQSAPVIGAAIVAVPQPAPTVQPSGLVLSGTVLRGTVRTDAGDPLPGATIFLRGTYLGTTTNQEGQFLLAVPAAASLSGRPLSVSYASYETQDVPLPVDAGAPLDIVLAAALTPLTQVVSAASRVEERSLQAPVTIEKVSGARLATLPAPDLLRGLAQLKGVDVSSAGLLASSLSTRGFNSPTSERLVQLTDYFDTQSPSLNVNVGNLFGPSDLDIASVELLYGPASALYGANAFNGVLLFNTRDPFLDPGLSVRLRGGERGLLDGQLRYAHKLSERLAFKLTGSYLRARDYVAGSEAAVDELTDPRNNPAGSALGSDLVNRYGDVGNTFTPQQNPFFPGGVAPGLYNRTVVAPGFAERDLVAGDDQVRSWKVQPALAYLLSSQVKATVSATLTGSTTGFQSANRYRLRDFQYRQYRAEVKGEQWFVRLSAAQDDGGDSYNLDLLGAFLQNGSPTPPPAPGSRPLSYRDLYFGVYNSVYGGAIRGGATDLQAQAAARQAASATQLVPGSAEFNARRAAIIADATPTQGARLNPSSWLHEATAQRALQLAQQTSLIVGGAYRAYRLGSAGTYFADEPGGPRLRNYEYGAYTQLTQTLLPEQRLKLALAGRVDDFRNFKAVFSPRASAVFSLGDKKQHNLRTSFGQAFRSPTQADQYNRLDIGLVLLQGNVGGGYAGYRVPAARAAQFAGAVFGDPAQLAPFVFRADPLRLERLTTFEGGYQGLLGEKLFVDVVYFRNFYRDFIGSYAFLGRVDGGLATQAELQTAVTTQFQGTNLRVLRVQANAAQAVQTQGVTAAASYRVAPALSLNANYSFNELLKKDELPADFQTFYNTPRHKYNAGLSGTLRNRLTYNLNYRWAQAHRYETPFASGNLPRYAALDAFVAYPLAPLKTTVQLGANNLLGRANQSAYGGPLMGRLVYAGLQLDLK